MPELPEVQTIVQDLKAPLIGQTIDAMEIRLPKSVWLDDVRAVGHEEVYSIKSIVEGKTIESITRRGKMIIINLSSEVVMLVHLKMTGQLIYVGPNSQRIAGGHPTSDMVRDLPVTSTRVVFAFANNGILYFNDQRQFGYIKILTKQSLASHKPYTSYGPEPLEEAFNEQYMSSIIDKRPKLNIKQLLLDQTLIAGIGNIYADESLFSAQILPTRTAGSLSPEDIARLVSSIKSVLRTGLFYGGTSSQHYVQANGSKGTMQDHLAVYRRTELPCPQCGTPIKRIALAGRGTHYCPNCQH
jgi:formamidopyrimidine-DNA glycosylase